MKTFRKLLDNKVDEAVNKAKPGRKMVVKDLKVKTLSSSKIRFPKPDTLPCLAVSRFQVIGLILEDYVVQKAFYECYSYRKRCANIAHQSEYQKFKKI